MSDSAFDGEWIALVLRISPEPDSICGELADAAGGTWSFVGWLEFVAAVDAARAADAARNGDAADASRSGGGAAPTTHETGV